ncbi:MAG: hypothetical protein Q9167_007644 [Letrouitia subvulpina]
MKEAIANLLYNKIESRHNKLLSLSNTAAGSEAAEIDEDFKENLDDMRLGQKADEHTKSSVIASSVEGLLTMDTQEPPNPPMSNPIEPKTPEDEYNFNEVDSNKQSKILQEEVKAIKQSRLWVFELKNTVDQHKERGKTFDEILSLIPTRSAEYIRRACYTTGVSSASKKVRSNDRATRAFDMFEKNEGIPCRTADLRHLGRILNWHFEPRHHEQGIKLGLTVRVWIEFFKPGEGNPVPWYQNESNPILSSLSSGLP